MMRMIKILYPAILVALPLAAIWLWWQDGMWKYGEMPTHGLVHVIGGCSVALALHIAGKLRGRCRDR